MKTAFTTIAFALVALLLAFGHVAESKHYRSHDPVHVVANTIGPFNNPTETYPFYSLPFCTKTGRQVPHKQDLGETLSGSHKITTPYDVTFLDPVPWRALCEEYLSTVELKEFKDAIEDDFFFEMLIDDLPVWGYIGEVVHEEFLLGKAIQGARVYLYPHLHFSIGFNNDQIVSANVTTDAKRRVDITDLTTGQEVVFSYTVDWVHMPELKYSHRMARYADSTFLPTTFEIHWLSILNSIVLVLLLMVFLAVILMRILKKDFSKYMEIDEDELAEEETGWKMIHGDVFRNPDHLNLFVAFIGSGAQIFCTIFLLLFSVVIGVFKATRRGALLTAAILIYALCGLFGGMVSGRLYRQLKGTNWAWNTVLTAAVFPVPLSAVFAWVNTVAWNSNSTAALPFTTIALIVGIILFAHFPLTILGAIVGRNLTTEEFKPPSRTNKVPREIPKITAWYRHPLAQVFMAGFLPFSAIYIELHYIFASIWGHKIYSLFGILFIAFVLLVVVTSFITVALLYFQLAREDHRWWWTAFVNGGATGLFVFMYSFYYFYHRSNMDGVLQLSFYFGYMAIVSYAFFIMLGFVGFYSSFTFVNYIYSAVKTD